MLGGWRTARGLYRLLLALPRRMRRTRARLDFRADYERGIRIRPRADFGAYPCGGADGNSDVYAGRNRLLVSEQRQVQANRKRRETGADAIHRGASILAFRNHRARHELARRSIHPRTDQRPRALRSPADYRRVIRGRREPRHSGPWSGAGPPCRLRIGSMRCCREFVLVRSGGNRRSVASKSQAGSPRAKRQIVLVCAIGRQDERQRNRAQLALCRADRYAVAIRRPRRWTGSPARRRDRRNRRP